MSDDQQVASPEAAVAVDEKLKAFIEKNKDIVAMWINDHGNMRIPVIVQDGEYVWVNREQRRRMMRALRKRS